MPREARYEYCIFLIRCQFGQPWANAYGSHTSHGATGRYPPALLLILLFSTLGISVRTFFLQHLCLFSNWPFSGASACWNAKDREIVRSYTKELSWYQHWYPHLPRPHDRYWLAAILRPQKKREDYAHSLTHPPPPSYTGARFCACTASRDCRQQALIKINS